MPAAPQAFAFPAPAAFPQRAAAVRARSYRRVAPTAVLSRRVRGRTLADAAGGTAAAPRRAPGSAAAVPLEAGSGGSGGGEGGSSGRGGDGGEGGELPPEVVAVLAAAARSAESVAPEVLAAAAAGRVAPEVLARVLAVEAWPVMGVLVRAWPALRNRLVANARFPLQMGVELTVGVTTKTLAEVSMRGERFWKEFDFYTSDLALEIVGDAMLVWLLSPVAFFGMGSATAGVRGFLQRLPKHAFQAGRFSGVQRGTAFMYKGVQFAVVGFLSSVVGHSLTTALVNRRKAAETRRRESHDEVELAPVLPTSLAWGGFMFCSSNPRYQMLNGLEQRLLFPLLEGHPLLSTAVTFGARFGNCFAGGVHWIPFAKFFGIQ